VGPEDAKRFTPRAGDKVLVTVDGWFTAPDGSTYDTVFGTFRGAFSSEDVLGIRTNARSTNWYAVVGNVTIAGCRIHYVVRTDHCSRGDCKSWSMDAANGARVENTPCRVYFADEEDQLQVRRPEE
jgi:hypothetical protein